MTNDQNLGDDFNKRVDDTPDRAREFTDNTHQNAQDFSEDARQSAPQFDTNPAAITKEGKNIALIAHLTLIGWIIAIVMNSNTKSEFGSFYIRQVLGLGLCMLVLNFIPILGWILSLVVVVLWIMSLIAAAGGEKKLTPVVGAYFQDWFKSL